MIDPKIILKSTDIEYESIRFMINGVEIKPEPDKPTEIIIDNEEEWENVIENLQDMANDGLINLSYE